ncbi:Peptide deformylase 1 [Frankia sp. AiPs1]|uniref:peptide deformylase n=1 Tax=Frankia sp. AiPa1 TaxID=573492 RepID=UPI00202AF042|nr:peptide deformylase [Frankia sp. AiPa1]MCL9761322.1 peptide deformylase [Frankia sp. AiPa1]
MTTWTDQRGDAVPDAAPDNHLTELVEAVLSAPRPWSIVQAGEPVLRRPAARYDGQLADGLLHRLLDAMREHLPDRGVGLAAPQIGIPLALAVIEDPATVPAELAEVRERPPLATLELINPVLTPIGTARRAFYEGCLSVVGYAAVVSRHHRVRLDLLDRHGVPHRHELAGWPARIAQHETDHLHGTLYLDRAESRSLSSMANLERLWNQATPAEAADALRFPL